MVRDCTTAPSDEELACRAQQGCAASFEELMRRFQTPVLHFLRRLGASTDAEDLLQEAFLRAYQNLHRYRSKWRFATWMFTIARRICINNARGVRPTENGNAIASLPSEAPGPMETLVIKESRQGLWDEAAQILNEEELLAIWLHYVEDMSTRDIAVILERSRVAVKTMMFRARRKLRNSLKLASPTNEAGARVAAEDLTTPLCVEGTVVRSVEASHA